MGREPEASAPQILVALGNSFFNRRIQGIRSSSTIRSKSARAKPGSIYMSIISRSNPLMLAARLNGAQNCNEISVSSPISLRNSLVHLDDMGEPALVIKIRSANFLQIIPVANQGSGPIHVRHIGFAVLHFLPDGFCFDIVNVIIENRDIDAVFLLNFQGAHDQQLCICIKFFCGRPDFIHRKFVQSGRKPAPGPESRSWRLRIFGRHFLKMKIFFRPRSTLS